MIYIIPLPSASDNEPPELLRFVDEKDIEQYAIKHYHDYLESNGLDYEFEPLYLNESVDAITENRDGYLLIEDVNDLKRALNYEGAHQETVRKLLNEINVKMTESFTTLPIDTNAGELILSSPYDPPSDLISTIITYNIIKETYDDIYRDLKTKNNEEPTLEQWQAIAEEIKQEVKIEYLFNGQHGFLQKAIDYAVSVNDKELEDDLRNVTPPASPEFISNLDQTNTVATKNKIQIEKKKQKKNKEQRKARRANRKRK